MKLREQIEKLTSSYEIDAERALQREILELFQKWATEIAENDKVGSLYHYWEGEAPYPTEVVADVQADIVKLIKEDTK